MVATSVQKAAKKLDLDQKLIELPRSYFIRAEDVGFTKGTPQTYLSKYGKNKEMTEVVNDACEAFLELMGAEKVERDAFNDAGEQLFEEVTGINDRGEQVVFAEPKKDIRSYWGIKFEETGSNEGNPRPRPKHWMLYVKTNWRILLPHIRWFSAKPGKKRTQEVIDHQLDPERNERRRDGLKAIRRVLENKPGERLTTWDGES